MHHPTACWRVVHYLWAPGNGENRHFLPEKRTRPAGSGAASLPAMVGVTPHTPRPLAIFGLEEGFY